MAKQLKSIDFIKILLFILITSMIACSTSTETASKKSKDLRVAYLHLRIGTSYLKAEKYPQAIQELKNANRLDPKNHVILNNLGLAYFGRGKAELAIQTIKQAILIHPNYTEAKYNLARILISQTKYKKAVAILQDAKKDLTYVSPENIHSSLGEAYYQLNEYQKAHSELSIALQTNRKFCPALRFHGQVLYFLKDYKNAASSLDQALANCDKLKMPEVLYYSGLSYFKLGQVEKSEARLNELIKLDVDSKYILDAKRILDSFSL